MSKIPVAVIGAGLIGMTHIDRALKDAAIELVGIADPSGSAAAFGRSAGIPCFADYQSLLEQHSPRAVVVRLPINPTLKSRSIVCNKARRYWSKNPSLTL